LKTIEITISPTGQATVQTKGFSGASCQSASRFLEQALGKRTADERTPEFYHTAEVQQSVREGA
jgi:hypothetical protein